MSAERRLETRLATTAVLVLSALIGALISIAAAVLMSGLILLAASNLVVVRSDGKTSFGLRRHGWGRRLLLACEAVAILAFSGVAFARVPLGLVFYLGE